jgi:gliding motility-associated-like protein
MLKQRLFILGFVTVCVTSLFSQNLILNPDCELPTVNDKIPNWTEVAGNTWHPNSMDMPPQSGRFYFFPGTASRIAELSQEVDVSKYACPIDLGRQRFNFTGYMRCFDQFPADIAHIYVEYLNLNGNILDDYGSGLRSPTSAWLQVTDSRLAPVGTRRIRIRLVSTRLNGSDNDGSYDNLSLVPSPALLKIDTIRQTTASCNLPNGTARISVSGGVPPFKFKMDTQAQTADSVFANLSSGNHFIIVTDAMNCTTSMSIPIGNVVGPSFTSVQATPSVCGLKNGSLTITARNGSGILTYKLGNLAARSQTKFDSLAGGRYLLTIRDSIGCTDTMTLNVAEKSRPTIDSVRIVPANCNKNNGQITVFGRAETSMQYSLDSITFAAASIFNNLIDKNYTVFLKDTNKCVVSKPAIVARLTPPTFDSVTVKPSTCAKDNGSILVAAKNVSVSIDSIIFGATRQYLNVRGGNYTIYIRDSGNCVVSQKAVVPKVLPPSIDDIKLVPESCKKNDGQILIKATTTLGRLAYSLDSNFVFRDSFLNLTSGIFTIAVRDSFNCIVKQNTSVKNQSTPIIEEIKTTPSVCDVGSGVILVTSKSSGRELFYSIDGTKFQKEYIFRNIKPGKYNITVKDINNCQSTASAEVPRDCGLFIPNVFSPNNDGNNDLFSFFGDATKVDKVVEFKVFSRWGVLLFSDETVQMNNINTGWDGRFRGREVETGIYVYYLKVLMKDGTNFEQKGDVTLLR